MTGLSHPLVVLGYFSLSTSIGLTHLLSPLHFVFASNPELLVLQTQPHGHRKHKWQGSLLNLWSGRFLTCFLSDAFVSFIHHPCLRSSAGHLFYRLCYCLPSFPSLSLSSFGYVIIQVNPQMEQKQQAAKETTVDADSSSSPSTQVRRASSFFFPPSWRG